MQACRARGNGLVRGRCGADGQRRTDDDCEQCWTVSAALSPSVPAPIISLI